MVNALQVAAAEVDRGVLAPVAAKDRTIPEEMAISSALQSGALPDVVSYRFTCTVCGDAFALTADIHDGNGEWKRNDETNPPG
jgi:hypothetical protein